MRKHCARVSVLVFLCLFAIAIQVDAQEVVNELGLYTDFSADPASASISVEPYTLFEAHLIVVNPVNFKYMPSTLHDPTVRPLDEIVGFACRIDFPKTGFVMGEFVPAAPANSNAVAPDWLIGYVENIPVPEDRIVHLGTFRMMVFDSEPKEIRLANSDIYGASWMILVDGVHTVLETKYVPLSAASGSVNLPVFGINRTVVATDRDTWDGVKALYR